MLIVHWEINNVILIDNVNIFRERTHICVILQIAKTEVGDAEENAIRCFKGAMAERGESSVKYSVSTRHRSNTFAILNIVGEQYLRCVYARLPILKREKDEFSPEGSQRAGPSSYLLHLAILKISQAVSLPSCFSLLLGSPYSSISRFEHPSSLCVEIRLGLLINIKTSDSFGYVGWFFNFSEISSVNRYSFCDVYQIQE